MRLTALIASLCATFGCVHQPVDESKPQNGSPVFGDKDCASYAPNHSIALSRDLEARLVQSLSPNHVPSPHCWYVTPTGMLLLRGGQPLPPTDHEDAYPSCTKRVGVPQENVESSDTEPTGNAALDLSGYRPDRNRGLVEVCFVDQGFGWHLYMFSMFTGD
jgi:hypothetical protein